MKKTLKQLQKRIAAMPREELDRLVENIVCELYMEEFLEEDMEWDVETIEHVNAHVVAAKLNPDNL